MPLKLAITLLFSLAFSTAAPAPNDPAGPQRLVRLAHSVDHFGLRLLAHLEASQSRNERPQNLLISPLSISSVLTTLLGGSAQQTKEQLYRALGYEEAHLTEAEIQENYSILRNRLNEQLKKTDNVLEVADAVAIQKGYPILESFLKTLNQDEELMTKNFQSEAHKATDEINQWVDQKTHSKIPELFEQDIDSAAVMVLLNAIYFKGHWKTSFEAKLTEKKPFIYHGRDGTEGELVQMMYRHGIFGHAHFEGEGDLLEIPFANQSTSFIVFLPSESHASSSSLTSLFAGNSTIVLAERLAHLRHAEVHVHLPKFKIESSYSLVEPLKHLGIEDAFTQDRADFSRINGKTKDLFVSAVAHKATIEINEQGSEASAGTGVIVVPESAQLPIYFNANRPFFFMIYDKEYQVALFSGLVNKP